VRYSTGWDPSDKIRNVAPRAEMLADPLVREGLGVLSSMGLSFDAWVYHTQIGEVSDVARNFPDLTIILNHVGSPILGGPYRGQSEAVFQDWKASIDEVAREPNVVMKLGALPIALPGEKRDRSKPPGSEEVAQAWRPWLEHCIDAFGADRCMFESNFPVQRKWCSYQVVWNAFKRVARNASDGEKSDLFFGTANRAYHVFD
jgi:predicted TIM-barrel fold metal-dependent hydrolase